MSIEQIIIIVLVCLLVIETIGIVYTKLIVMENTRVEVERIRRLEEINKEVMAANRTFKEVELIKHDNTAFAITCNGVELLPNGWRAAIKALSEGKE